VAEGKKPVQFELTVERKEKLDEIAKREDRSVANIVEFVFSNWLDGVQVSQFGMASHPAFGGLVSHREGKKS
jgi:hypothetical protein